MNESDAVEVIQLLEAAGVEVYVDGGWAVDALLGKETRPHADLDIAVPERDVPRLREVLSARAYRETARKDSWECNFVLADEAGRAIDVHSYTLDETGANVHGIAYQGRDLTGQGVIAGCRVRCICVESLLRFHTGYAHDENDARDVEALCLRFALPLPEGY
jgi:lincosamide nucleotidyltransferase A/C/D/E